MDKSGNPIKVDKFGNLVDKNGNLVDEKGNQIFDKKGGPITVD